jgi:hypothetical protein
MSAVRFGVFKVTERAFPPRPVERGIVVETLRLEVEAWVDVEAEIVVFLTKCLRGQDRATAFGV